MHILPFLEGSDFAQKCTKLMLTLPGARKSAASICTADLLPILTNEPISFYLFFFVFLNMDDFLNFNSEHIFALKENLLNTKFNFLISFSQNPFVIQNTHFYPNSFTKIWNSNFLSSLCNKTLLLAYKKFWCLNQSKMILKFLNTKIFHRSERGTSDKCTSRNSLNGYYDKYNFIIYLLLVTKICQVTSYYWFLLLLCTF